MLLSSPNYTAVAKKELPTAPFRQYVHGVQQLKECDTTPTSSQSFVNGEGNPSNEFRQLPTFAPSAHPYSPMQESSQCAWPDKTVKAFIPLHPDYRLTASACKCCCSGGSYSCMASAYYTYCVCQLDCSVAYLLSNGLTLPWQASDAPDLQSDWNRNAVTQTRLDSGLQAAYFYSVHPPPPPPANEDKAD